MSRVRTLLRGAGICFAGFRFWLRRPGVMLLGAVPAIIVGAALLAGWIVLGIAAMPIATAITPFADAWADPWPDVLRIAVAIAIEASAVLLGVLLFAAVTLMVGAPFYERIWRAVEEDLGGVPGEVRLTTGQALAKGIDDGLRLLGVAILTGLVVLLVGLIPVVGGVLGAILGALVGGRAIATELTGMPADARGLSLDERRRLLRSQRDLTMGFGIAVYLLFLIPGGAVVGTPAMTVGATVLVRTLRGEPVEPVSQRA